MQCSRLRADGEEKRQGNVPFKSHAGRFQTCTGYLGPPWSSKKWTARDFGNASVIGVGDAERSVGNVGPVGSHAAAATATTASDIQNKSAKLHQASSLYTRYILHMYVCVQSHVHV